MQMHQDSRPQLIQMYDIRKMHTHSHSLLLANTEISPKIFYAVRYHRSTLRQSRCAFVCVCHESMRHGIGRMKLWKAV